jgi:hypothetical protein
VSAELDISWYRQVPGQLATDFISLAGSGVAKLMLWGIHLVYRSRQERAAVMCADRLCVGRRMILYDP